jgi:hypothetical protein
LHSEHPSYLIHGAGSALPGADRFLKQHYIGALEAVAFLQSRKDCVAIAGTVQVQGERRDRAFCCCSLRGQLLAGDSQRQQQQEDRKKGDALESAGTTLPNLRLFGGGQRPARAASELSNAGSA